MMRNTLSRFALWTVPFLLVIVPTPRDVVAAPEVHNGPAPAESAATMSLTELWRIGGPDDDENLLGVINKVLADGDGNLYLLDIQLTEVQVYDPDGQYVRSLGKRGDGPGELRSVTDALFLPDGTMGLV